MGRRLADNVDDEGGWRADAGEGAGKVSTNVHLDTPPASRHFHEAFLWEARYIPSQSRHENGLGMKTTRSTYRLHPVPQSGCLVSRGLGLLAHNVMLVGADRRHRHCRQTIAWIFNTEKRH